MVKQLHRRFERIGRLHGYLGGLCALSVFCRRTMNNRGASVGTLSVEELQVVFLEFLDTSEKGNFRFGETFVREKLGAGKLQRAGNVRDLKKPIAGRFHVGDEFGARGEDGERFLEERCQFGLSVVVIDFKFLVRGQLVRLRQQKSDDLLEKRVMNIVMRTDEVLVDDKTLVGDIHIVEEEEHSAEDAPALFSAHARILALASDQRPGMNAMKSVEPHGFERAFKLFYFSGDLDGLIVEDHADKIVARRQPIMLVAAGFVYEYADLACSHRNSSSGNTKARIAPRLRQESFPLAGDAGFRHCRLVVYQKRPCFARGFRRKSRRQGPDLSPALHRIAEAQRSVNNPSWGSVKILSNSLRWCKGQNSKFRNLDVSRGIGQIPPWIMTSSTAYATS